MILLIQGNALSIPLADKSVHCIVTSPPYWGLRSYAGTATWEGGAEGCDHVDRPGRNDYETIPRPKGGHKEGAQPDPILFSDTCLKCGARRIDAQLGSEPLHDCLGWATGADCGVCYICHMRQVARECWRVLRDDGVMFWNIADSYVNNPSTTEIPRSEQGNGSGVFRIPDEKHVQARRQKPNRMTEMKHNGLKPKDKCGIPERTALAFQADGWYWRSGITWVKPNPMPESVTDRPTKSTEMIYVFTKSERYAWDAEAVREENNHNPDTGWAKQRAQGREPGVIRDKFSDDRNDRGTVDLMGIEYRTAGRNLRDAWTMSTQAYPGAHFATFPSELPRRCIKAGTSERGCCPKCGKGWVRVVETEYKKGYRTGHLGFRAKGDASGMVDMSKYPALDKHTTTLGWRPACTCDAGDPIPCTVLDPFSGAATTILVARELGRNGIGLELSGEYLQQSRERLSMAALDAWKGNGKNHKPVDFDGLPLFLLDGE
jgi:DNA modification methylase